MLTHLFQLDPLQWGLGENPGRNAGCLRPASRPAQGFNGAWAKTQEGTSTRCRSGLAGPRFNGAWAKTQEGTGREGRRDAHREASMGPGRKPRKEPVVQRGRRAAGGGASMGPGRKPRKERDLDGRYIGDCWLQWGLGENPGRNRRSLTSYHPRPRFNGAWAKTQEGTAVRLQRGVLGVASMGPGRKPRKELERHRGGQPRRRRASMGPGRKPRKEPSGTIDIQIRSEVLQWGLGENPGRNPRAAPVGPRRDGFNGAWAKTQEGTTRRSRSSATGRRFNGAWAKTQEGTINRSRP